MSDTLQLSCSRSADTAMLPNLTIRFR